MISASSHLSLWNLFWSSGGMVLAVMMGLIAASVYSWAVVIMTMRRLYDLEKKSQLFERGFWSGESLDIFYNRLSSLPHDPFQAMFLAGMREWKWLKASTHEPDPDKLGRRTHQAMLAVIEKEIPPLQQRLGFLASLGSTAPFIGLFGTVWGIMHSFQGIAASQSTSLATVAPAIAEALLATGIGLFAAIPAVAAYNFLFNYLEAYNHRLETFATEFSSLMVHQAEDTNKRGISTDL